MNKTSTAPKKRTCFHIEEATLNSFLEVCKREGEVASHKIEKFMLHYNQAHSRGNPQLTMVSYVDPESPQPMRVLCAYCDGAVSDGKIHCKRAGMWVPGVQCYSCDRNQLRKKKE